LTEIAPFPQVVALPVFVVLVVALLVFLVLVVRTTTRV